MTPAEYEADYVVIGGGASAMAFVDEMLQSSDATFAVVDRRHAPSGHWNDAYPFVRLHQDSITYGVGSRRLGRDRKDTSGLNAGFYELASGVEITNYYHRLMEDVFLPSGRVRYFPLSESRGDSTVVSLLSGATTRLRARRKRVDATLLTTSVPSTHARRFEVADGVTCIAPNDLPKLATTHDTITVLGGGKTGVDSVTWLASNGYPSSAVAWVVPRDAWFINRARTQPAYEFFDEVFGGAALQSEICATAETVEDLCARLEQAGIWFRVDPNVWPRMFHAAVLSERELNALRSVGRIIRLGRVSRIEPDRMVLAQGTVDARPDTLYVDCTASAVGHNVGQRMPVFRASEINLQMVRPFQPCFSAALIGHIEATHEDDARNYAGKNALCRPTPMTDTVEDWLTVHADGLINAGNWSQDAEVAVWLRHSRLNHHAEIAAQGADDPDKRELLARIATFGAQAPRNLKRLAGLAARG